MKNSIAFVLVWLAVTGLCAQWSVDPQNPNLIAGFPAEQVMPKVAICDNGNAYICRFDNNGGSYKVYLNLLAADGTPAWTSPQGLLISEHNQMTWLTEYDLTVDNDGNAVIVFQDIRNSGANNVVAYKISPQQAFLWGADGIPLSSDTNPDFGNMSPVVFNSNDNNTYVAWQRMGTTTSIVIQCLNPAGQKLWTENGIMLTPPAGSYTWPQIIQSDFDNIHLKYYHDTGPVWAPTRHTYVAKYNTQGQQQWNTVITNAGGLTAWQQLIPFEPDGAGGAVLAWYEDRENDMDTDIYAQRVTASGAVSMPANGALVSVDPANQQYYPQVTVDRENQQIYVFFRVTDANQNSWGLGRQMLDFAGNRMWGETAPLFVNIGGLE
ncbi:MAG TPA: hypothetical protein PKH19_05135, partial [Candidatus Syntrophosphaera sp.]|nr:hypothetical protein [Candidatus Syntrophosphaera sp.]